MKYRAALSVAAALALGGCEFAPDYHTPAVTLPSQFTDSAGATGGIYAPRGEWWRVFNDRELNLLEAQVEEANPNLAAAYAAYQAARARSDQAVAGLFPEVDFGSSLSADKQSANRPLRSSNQPTYYGANQLQAGVASYEIDIWGRVADLVKAAKYTSEAAGDAFADARLALHAELARDYVDVRGIDQEAKLLNDITKLYQNAYNLTEDRLNAKISPPIDAQRALTQLEYVKSQVSDLQFRRTQLVDAIATLTGKAAAGFQIAVNSAPIAFPRRPRAVPGEVLRRRPDVAQAERNFAAAIAVVGSARANMYPKFTIGLLGGTQDTSLRLLDPANTFYSIGPSMTVPLFDFGLRESQVREAEDRAKIAAELYRATVLRAVQEVQDNLHGIKWLAIEAQQSQSASTAAQTALNEALAPYREGTASFLDVVTAEQESLGAQRAVLSVRTREMESYVGLLLALGGGWTIPVEEPTAKVASMGSFARFIPGETP